MRNFQGLDPIPLSAGPPKQNDPTTVAGARPPKSGPMGHQWVAHNMDTREPLPKQFLSEESMATHFSQLSLHNDPPPTIVPL